MLGRCSGLAAVLWYIFALALTASSSNPVPSSAFPQSVQFGPHEAASCQSPDAQSCPGLRASDAAEPQHSMLQKQFKTGSTKAILEGDKNHLHSLERHAASSREGVSKKYVWMRNSTQEHPRSIGKNHPHPSIQEYEAHLPYLGSMVLNIFPKVSNGDGGLLLVMEVPSPCDADRWVEVDRSRCSSRYPCALRLPSGVASTGEQSPTSFRTRVVTEDEDYLTDFLEYSHVTFDEDSEVVVAHEQYSEDTDKDRDEAVLVKRVVKFNLSPVIASGALYVTPVVKSATPDTIVTMRLRQPEAKALTTQMMAVEEVNLAQMTAEDKNMHKLDSTLRSYRKDWAEQWRAPSKAIGGCDFSHFEVVADQFYPGEVELEVWATGGTHAVEISDVLVTTRASWAEAEVSLLDMVLKDHFAFFNDPDEIVHGLPMDALKKENPRLLTDSNPCEWGYAMEAWIIMAETGSLKHHEAVAKLNETFSTLSTLQADPEQFTHGLFYPYYRLRDKISGKAQFPQRTEYKEMPCGDDALLYASMMMVKGWLKTHKFDGEAAACDAILGRMDFSQCIRKTDCSGAGNGIFAEEGKDDGDKFWSVPLTFNADTLEKNSYNWNVWADEGGLVGMVVALSGAVDDDKYESIVRQQQRYSPCTRWEGITVGHSAFFNSIFTLPTRSILGLGTLFASPYYHEFAVRTVLPSFRAHQKLKKKIGADYMGPSDAMSMMPKTHPGKFFGSYAYWPPNNMYDCRKGMTTKENQCTWCKGIQYEGLDDPFDMIVPHGNMASFLVAAMMEKSQFSGWLEDTKLLMTDWSEVYKPGYGLEVVAPAKRTPRGGKFEGAFDGRGIWESLSHGYTVLSMYEGLATMRGKYDLIVKAGYKVRGSYAPPDYKPLSNFVNALPKVRSRIDELLAIARNEESKEKKCEPSDYGPPGHY